jgi:hypothetical protein
VKFLTLTLPLWLSLVVAVSTPILTVLIALWTARLATRRQRAGQIEQTRTTLRNERRDAYVMYSMALEELAYWMSPKNVSVELEDSEIRLLKAALVKGRVRVRISGNRGTSSIIGNLDRIVQTIFEIRFKQELNTAPSPQLPPSEDLKKAEQVRGHMTAQMITIGSELIRLVHRAVVEVVRAELEVDTLLDPDSIKRDGRTKRLWRTLRLASIVHPIRGIRDVKKYLEGQRDMHLNSLAKSLQDVEEASRILNELRTDD